MWKIMNGRRRRMVLSIANELLAAIATKHRIGTAILRGKDFTADIVAARREFCVRGRADRIQTEVLAAALNCHHTTITYHSNYRYRSIKNARRKKGAGGHHGRTQAEEGFRQRDGNAMEGRGAPLRARHEPQARGLLGELDGPC